MNFSICHLNMSRATCRVVNNSIFLRSAGHDRTNSLPKVYSKQRTGPETSEESDTIALLRTCKEASSK